MATCEQTYSYFSPFLNFRCTAYDFPRVGGATLQNAKGVHFRAMYAYVLYPRRRKLDLLKCKGKQELDFSNRFETINLQLFLDSARFWSFKVAERSSVT
jgi:hypothetical protein